MSGAAAIRRRARGGGWRLPLLLGSALFALSGRGVAEAAWVTSCQGPASCRSAVSDPGGAAPRFVVERDGGAGALDLTLRVVPEPAAVGREQRIWVVAEVGGGLFALDDRGRWNRWSGDGPPVHRFRGALPAEWRLALVEGGDLRGLGAFRLAVGYGDDVGELLAAGRYGWAEVDPESAPPPDAAAPEPTPSPLPGSFVDSFEGYDGERWQVADGWANGDPFLNGWCAEQTRVADGRLTLTLEAGACAGREWASGAYQTRGRPGYGRYEARLRAAATPGTVSGFFVYTGPGEGSAHHEIDFEFFGDDPRRLQVNYWTDGVEHPTLFTLPFDASAAYHDYAFEWRADSIQWSVDGVPLHTESGDRGALPSLPGKLFFNLWGCRGIAPWCGDFTGGSASMAVEWVRFTP